MLLAVGAQTPVSTPKIMSDKLTAIKLWVRFVGMSAAIYASLSALGSLSLLADVGSKFITSGE